MAEMMFIASAVSAVTGQLAKGESQRQAYNYNRDLALTNAKQLEAASGIESQKMDRRTHSLLSQQRAQLAKSGLDISSSPLLLMEEAASDASLDQQNLAYNTSQGMGALQQEAYLSRRQAKAATKGSFLNAGQSLLSSGVNYQILKKGGIFNGMSQAT